LEVIVEIQIIRDECGKDPKTSDLIQRLNFSNQKVLTRVKTLQPKYLRIDKRNSGRFFVRIESDFRYTKNKIEEIYGIIISELKENIKLNFKRISDEICINAIRTFYPKIYHYAKHRKLSKTIETYRELLGILDEKNLNIGLHDIDKGTTGYRYILTNEGKDIYYTLMERGI
jgi:hypothetical protein